jgi:hypothetical protein
MDEFILFLAKRPTAVPGRSARRRQGFVPRAEQFQRDQRRAGQCNEQGSETLHSLLASRTPP